MSRRYPYPIDPAVVTAVDITGSRVELRKLAAAAAQSAPAAA